MSWLICHELVISYYYFNSFYNWVENWKLFLSTRCDKIKRYAGMKDYNMIQSGSRL